MALTKHKRFFFCLFIDHGGALLTQTFSSLSTRFKSRAIQSGIRQPLPDGRLISAIYLHRKEGKKKEQKKKKKQKHAPQLLAASKRIFFLFLLSLLCVLVLARSLGIHCVPIACF